MIFHSVEYGPRVSSIFGGELGKLSMWSEYISLADNPHEDFKVERSSESIEVTKVFIR
jgi:hypothetical protein